jgi:hypothetical protein
MSMKTKSWFKNFFGFKESEIPSTNRHAFLQEYIEIRNEDSEQGEIFCKENGKNYRFGRLEIASLADLRAQVQAVTSRLTLLHQTQIREKAKKKVVAVHGPDAATLRRAERLLERAKRAIDDAERAAAVARHHFAARDSGRLRQRG